MISPKRDILLPLPEGEGRRGYVSERTRAETRTERSETGRRTSATKRSEVPDPNTETRTPKP
ncbi:MAG: hypothetical protein KJ626_05575, partial [Verrucomicrobia bacterium]|nr:hypothetical protein [Verrucomicrobiota bacterium]